jgi:crotonobetainyl-CoA:carnitine CoA-transferase CaiB-like acyl-CoA transferase
VAGASRNKRSLALGLKKPAAQDVVRHLALDADVLIENFRAGAMGSFGLDPEALMATNARLIAGNGDSIVKRLMKAVGRNDLAADPAMADIAHDPHYQARGMLQSVVMDDGSLLGVPGIVPKLSRTPGGHRRNAPSLGQDNEVVLADLAARHREP